MFFCLQKPPLPFCPSKTCPYVLMSPPNPTLILSNKNLYQKLKHTVVTTIVNAIIAVFRLISWLWGGVFVTLQSQINR